MPDPCQYKIPSENSICTKYIDPDTEDQPGFCSKNYYFHCIEDLTNKIPRISFSSVKNFLRCSNLYYFSNICGIRKKPNFLNEAIKAGSMWGNFLAARHGQPQTNKEKFIQVYQPSDITLAKVNALMKAHVDLAVSVDKNCECEKEFLIPFYQWQLHGFIDRAYDDYIVESKLSARPDNYLSIPNIEMQAGTYLYSNPVYEYVVMEVTRMPQQRLSKNEEIEDFQARVYSDIIRRPSYYFIGWNNKTRTFGKKFYRSEFDLAELPMIYHRVVKMIRYCIDEGLWVKNELACHCPTTCDYYDIKKTGVISEDIYEVRAR